MIAPYPTATTQPRRPAGELATRPQAPRAAPQRAATAPRPANGPATAPTARPSPAPTTVTSPTGQTTMVPPPTILKPPTGLQLPTPMPMPVNPLPAGNAANITGVGAPGAPGAVAPAPAPLPQAPAGSQVRPVTGDEQPYHVLPGQSPQLTQLMQRLQQEAGRQLDQPTVYDDSLFKSAMDQGNAQLDERFNADTNSLDGELANRGLTRSSIAGGRLNDLYTDRSRQRDTLSSTLLRERAAAMAAGRSAAFNNASGLAGFENNVEAGQRGELRTERGYVDSLDQNAYDRATQTTQLQETLRRNRATEFQQALQTALNAGLPGLGAAQGAGALFGQGANAYGDLANQYGVDLGQLAQAAAEFFGRQG